MSDLINVNLCLSDIQKEKIFTSEKTGKKYISLTLQRKKEVDQYGKTHSLSIRQTKEEREAKANKVYVGDGTEIVFNQQAPSQQTQPTPKAAKPKKEEEDDNLPF